MNLPSDQATPARIVRTLQIIVIAMTIGASGFLVVTIVVKSMSDAPAEAPAHQRLFTYIAAAFALMVLTIRRFVSRLIVSQAYRRLTAGQPNPDAINAQLRNLLLTRTIIAAAMVEAAALFAGLAHLIEATTLSVIVAAVMVIILALPLSRSSSVTVTPIV